MTRSAAQRLRVGVLGAGGMAAQHLASWSRLGIPTAVYSPRRAAALAPAFGARHAQTVADLLDFADVIDICTPTDTHHDAALSAIKAHTHVICEKPLALGHSEAAEIVHAAKDAGVQLHVAHVVRYFAAYAIAREEVMRGAIGTPATLRLSRTGPAPDAAWFFDEHRSGGVLTDQLIHDLDYARWVAGPIETVGATAEHGAGNTVTATITLHHRSGAISELVGGWLGPKTVFTTSFSLIGELGELRHRSLEETLSLLPADARSAPRVWHTDGDLPYDTQLAEFAWAIDHGHAPRVIPGDALAAVDLAAAARTAAKTGRRVPVTPDSELTPDRL